VSCVVLGIVARDGPSTPYELKAAVGRGIAHFWPFPHSQIYSETERLAGLGLLAEEREDAGRRRRTYDITEAGRTALRDWLAEPTSEPPQIRSLALLKLFFGQFADPADLAMLAHAQLKSFEEHRVYFEQLLGHLERLGDRPWQLAVGRLMHDAHDAMIARWEQIARAAEVAAEGAEAEGAATDRS
jgi:DNA-binding PadR family transcriptional regulator